MTDQTPAPATARMGGPSSLRILVVGVAAAVLAISAAVALATTAPASPVLDNASAVGPGPADAAGFIGLAAATSQDGTATGGPVAGQLGRGGPGGGHGAQFHAITIAARDGSTLSLKTEDGWTRKITVESDTTITKAGVAIKLADLSVGDTIAFRQTRNTDGTFKVVEIRVIVPQTGGEVTAVSGNSLTLKLRDGSAKTVTLTDSTKYFLGSKAVTKGDVKVGSNVTAQGTTSGDTFTAINVTIRPDMVAGEVTAKTSDTITIKTRDGSSATVKVDSSTTYRVPGKDSATLADVTVGMQIAAQGSKNADGTFGAINVGSAPAMHNGGPGGRGGFGGPGMRGPGGTSPNAGPAPSSGTSSS